MMRVSRGNTIAGRYVPPGNLIGVTHWACYHSASNFKDPGKFVPERWLGDERYKDDRKDAFKPFSNGPRNCIGINLAYAEIRLILARLLWNFDMELCEESNDWVTGMKVYGVYQRPPLMIKLTRVARG
jgi:aspirochlorine biosynthesis cytochrome P450 monooxygenase